MIFFEIQFFRRELHFEGLFSKIMYRIGLIGKFPFLKKIS